MNHRERKLQFVLTVVPECLWDVEGLFIESLSGSTGYSAGMLIEGVQS